jgi:hypothetical protein
MNCILSMFVRSLAVVALVLAGAGGARGQSTFSKFYDLVSPGIVGFTDIIALDSSYILLGGSYNIDFWRVINLIQVDHQGNEIKRKVLANDTLDIATERLGKPVKCGEYWYVACMGLTAGLGPSAGLILGIDDTLGIRREIYLDHEPQEWLGALTCWRDEYIYAAGYSRPTHDQSQDLWFVQLDTAGNVLRDTTIGENVFEVTASIEVLPDGNLITAPARNAFFVDHQWDLVIMTLDTALNVLSEYTHTGPGEYCGGKLTINSNSMLNMICCYDTIILEDQEFDFVYFISKINSTGEFAWQEFMPSKHSYNYFNIINNTLNSDIVSVGWYNHPRIDTVNAIRAMIISVDSSGSRNWYRVYFAPANYDYNSELYDVIQTRDGGFLACGKNVRINGQARAWLLKLDSLGCLIPGCDTLGQVIGEGPVLLSLDDNLQVYPNPAGDRVHLLWRVEARQAAERSSYRLLTMEGREVLVGEVPQSAGRALLEVGALPPGAYVVEVRHGMERLARQRLLISR